MVHRRLAIIAAAFGLIHGSAIASALIDLGLPVSGRVWALAAFNFGVEAAQLSLVATVIPLTFVFRRSLLYRRCVLLPGSVRSEEHTSELQSLMRISYAVFCLKKNNDTTTHRKPRATIQTSDNRHLSL